MGGVRMSARVEQVRALARKLLPDAKLAEAHLQATYERGLEEVGRALVRLELAGEVEDEVELRAAMVELNERRGAACAALLDHASAVVNLARMFAEG